MIYMRPDVRLQRKRLGVYRIQLRQVNGQNLILKNKIVGAPHTCHVAFIVFLQLQSQYQLPTFCVDNTCVAEWVQKRIEYRHMLAFALDVQNHAKKKRCCSSFGVFF